MSEEKTNVFQRMQRVMDEVGVVAKNGKNTFQNYEYATESDFIHAIRPLLVKHGLIMYLADQVPTQVMPILKDQGEHTGKVLTTLLSTYKIVSVDDPEEYVQIKVVGQGIDNGDKGAYKAITGAKKYAISNAFLIPTGDDPEKDQTSRPKLKKLNSEVEF